MKLLIVVALLGLMAFGVSSANAAHWIPPQHLTWYWQLQGTVKTEPVMATDFDGFDNTAATVTKFHSLGQKAICYIDVGTAENFRPDYSKFTALKPTVLGKTNGWPGERWLNVADTRIRPILHARVQMCKTKGFDAVEPDNMDGWENSTGFTITAAQQRTFNEWIASDVHTLNMAVFQKNDPEQFRIMPYFDGAIDEQCNQYSECSSFQPYLTAGKPVLNAEYQSSQMAKACPADKKLGIMGALFNLNLDGKTYKPCWP